MSVPYIGSKISLISKSEIRYEGILYTIDPKESTVALQHVRSFGTEGRRKDGDQIPPSNEVYDYIIFRGSDIKDLHVCEPPQAQQQPQQPRTVPNDPAIISMPPGAPPQGQAQMPNMYSQNFGFPPVPNYQQFNPNFTPYGYMGNSYFGAFAQPTMPQQQAQGQRGQTTGTDAAKGTTAQPAQQGQQQSQKSATPSTSTTPATPASQPSTNASSATSPANVPASTKPTQPVAPQTGVPIVQGSTPMPSVTPVQPQQQIPARAPQEQAQQAPNQQSAQQQVPIAETPEDGQNISQQRGQRPPRRGMNYSNNRGGPSGGRGGRRGGPSGGRGGYSNTGTKIMEEFDFAGANARFDKEKILEEVASKDSDGKQPAYDKASSFFDNISCEATERKEERGVARQSLAEQRKIDAETFGYSANRRDYSGRGRGGRRPPHGQHQQQGQQGQQQQQGPQQGQQQFNNQGNYGYQNRNPQQKVFRPVNQNNNNNAGGERRPTRGGWGQHRSGGPSSNANGPDQQ